MKGQNCYFVTALPPLGKLGSEPPTTGRELIDRIAENDAGRAAVEALLLGGDLVQREALGSGEIEQATPIVLTEAQLRDEQPLPPYLTAGQDEADRRRVAVDAVWECYFRHAASVAEETHNAFLGEWVGYEVALRNALATRRAKTLDLEAGDYLVATDLASDDEDFSLLVSEWSAAPDPLTGLQLLDRGRWEWLCEHDRWFTFADDELAAYAAKLVLLERWGAMSKHPKTGTDRQDAADESMRNQT